MRPMFQGSIVALVTPFRGGKVDEAKLKELVEMHVAQGTDGIVPCGTTGESPTLSHDEHRRVVEIVVEAARKRLAERLPKSEPVWVITKEVGTVDDWAQR